jgi:hypothetical protein
MVEDLKWVWRELHKYNMGFHNVYETARLDSRTLLVERLHSSCILTSNLQQAAILFFLSFSLPSTLESSLFIHPVSYNIDKNMVVMVTILKEKGCRNQFRLN